MPDQEKKVPVYLTPQQADALLAWLEAWERVDPHFQAIRQKVISATGEALRRHG